MNRPLVSVILPFYNASGTLQAAVRSIIEQTVKEWELVLFDDGSDDGSSELAAELARCDQRIRLVTSRHVGIVAALARACAESGGKYLARMDADDVSHRRRLELQLAAMVQDESLGLCGTQVRMVGESIRCGRQRYETWINSVVSHEEIIRELFVECPMPHPTFFMRREAYEAVGGYQEHGWAEDYDLCMRMFLHGKRFAKVAAPLLDWAESPTRLSVVSSRYSPAQFRAIKRHYMFNTHLSGGRPFCQWGAGEIGKPWLREWSEKRPRFVVDINLRKIGERIHGYEIISPQDLGKPGEHYIVVAVGAPGARDEIRQFLQPRGFTEVLDYTFVA